MLRSLSHILVTAPTEMIHLNIFSLATDHQTFALTTLARSLTLNFVNLPNFVLRHKISTSLVICGTVKISCRGQIYSTLILYIFLRVD